MRRTKIVATLGPSSDTPELIRSLIEAGVDVFRLNASHGTMADHVRRLTCVREEAAGIGKHVAVLLDLQGPKIRLEKFEGGSAELREGSRFVLSTESVLGTAERASTTYKEFARDVKPGDPVLLADGMLELRVVATDSVSAECEVVRGGRISDRKGINLPGVKLSTAAVTEKDRADFEAGLAAGIDLVALSFVRRPEDVEPVYEIMAAKGIKIPVVAKIEKPEALQNIDEIIDRVEGVMVARGDLGVEVALEKVPSIQKDLIRRARRAGKFVITATQMLESMIENATPTRAEVSDVANAIYDGTDALMLSAETGAGKFPVEAVEMMARIAIQADQAVRTRPVDASMIAGLPANGQIVAHAARSAALEWPAKAVVVFTTMGIGAILLSRLRPSTPCYAFTPFENVARQMAVRFAVTPILAPPVESTDKMLSQVERMLLDMKLAEAGDPIVVVAGQPIGRAGSTNLMKLHRIGEAR
jgi:pyruvate kinase